MGLDVRTWDEFLAADGVSDVVETISIGPWSMDSDGPVDPSLALMISFSFRGTPCGHECMFYVGRCTDREWGDPDAHTAMVEATRAGLVALVSDHNRWCLT